MNVRDGVVGILARTAAATDRYLAPLRKTAFKTLYRDRYELPPSEVQGELDLPDYRAPTGLKEGGVQTTLDGVRAYGQFLSEVPQLDAELRDQYDSGINTALLWGSTVRGTALLDDATVFDDEHVARPSDIDWLILLEAEETERYGPQQETVLDYAEQLRYDVRPEVRGKDDFTEELRQARENSDSLDDLRSAWVTIKDGNRTVPAPYLSRLRQFIPGYVPHPDFQDNAVLDELGTGIDTILEEDGTIPDIIQPDLAVGGITVSTYETRMQDLEQNYSLGRQRRGQ